MSDEELEKRAIIFGYRLNRTAGELEHCQEPTAIQNSPKSITNISEFKKLSEKGTHLMTAYEYALSKVGQYDEAEQGVIDAASNLRAFMNSKEYLMLLGFEKGHKT